MKKQIKNLLCLSIMSMVSCMSVVGCEKENIVPKVSKVELSSGKTSYSLGEKLEEFAFKVTYDNGEEKNISSNEGLLDAASFDPYIVGKYPLSFSYEGISTTFDVDVVFVPKTEADIFITNNKANVINTYRNTYHFNAPIGWINDPNGLCYYDGHIHLFYQYNPYSESWDTMHWGHAVSKDFIKFSDLPVALYPDTPNVDKALGCWSGSALVEDDTMHIFYTGATNAQQTCYATSNDGINFVKYQNNPIMPTAKAPENTRADGFRDPSVFKNGDSYYILIGTEDKDAGGQMHLYRSHNLTNWFYVGNVLKNTKYQRVNGCIECAEYEKIDGYDFILGGFMNYAGKGRYEFQNQSPVCYALGNLDLKTADFSATEIHDIDYGFDFYAPQIVSLPDGRKIMIGWMQGQGRSNPLQNAKHRWCGIYSLPRELSIVDDKLYQKPIKEIQNYFIDEVHVPDFSINSNDNVVKNIQGNKINLSFDLDINTASKAGVKLLQGDTEYCKLYLDTTDNCVVFDRTMGGLEITGQENNLDSRRCKVDLTKKVSLDIFIDVSTVEVFINNGEQVMSSLVYPKESGQSISFFAENGNALFSNVIKRDILV